jgi:uncharacterized protein with GYD domain
MPKYLWEVSYTTEGTKGLLKDGASKRRAVVEKLVAEVGGRLDTFYWALGKADAYIIADVPTTEAAVAISMTVHAAGGATLRTIPLLTAEEVDRAAKTHITYTAPGR